MIRLTAPTGKPYRVSSDSAWPLRMADGRKPYEVAGPRLRASDIERKKA